jgi:hypothetical protein
LFWVGGGGSSTDAGTPVVQVLPIFFGEEQSVSFFDHNWEIHISIIRKMERTLFF